MYSPGYKVRSNPSTAKSRPALSGHMLWIWVPVRLRSSRSRTIMAVIQHRFCSRNWKMNQLVVLHNPLFLVIVDYWRFVFMILHSSSSLWVNTAWQKLVTLSVDSQQKVARQLVSGPRFKAPKAFVSNSKSFHIGNCWDFESFGGRAIAWIDMNPIKSEDLHNVPSPS